MLSIRFVVLQRTCEEAIPRVPDDYGKCVCPPGSIASAKGCLSLATLLLSLLLPLAFLAVAAALWQIRRRNQLVSLTVPGFAGWKGAIYPLRGVKRNKNKLAIFTNIQHQQKRLLLTKTEQDSNVAGRKFVTDKARSNRILWPWRNTWNRIPWSHCKSKVLHTSSSEQNWVEAHWSSWFFPCKIYNCYIVHF